MPILPCQTQSHITCSDRPTGRVQAALQEKQPVYFVTDPFDVLAPADEDRIRGLLAGSKETKQ
jgi:hypothetical protein